MFSIHDVQHRQSERNKLNDDYQSWLAKGNKPEVLPSFSEQFIDTERKRWNSENGSLKK